jgi:hypothetical protein
LLGLFLLSPGANVDDANKSSNNNSSAEGARRREKHPPLSAMGLSSLVPLRERASCVFNQLPITITYVPNASIKTGPLIVSPLPICERIRGNFLQ